MTISAEAQKSVEKIHNSKKRVGESIAKDPKSLSSDTLKKFTKSLSDVDGSVVEAILLRKEDVIENVDLRELVDEYFRASLQTLEFLSEVENCLRDLTLGHYYLIAAIKKYKKKKLKECQDELQQFLDIGDPFQKRFYPMLNKLCVRQQGLLDNVKKTFDEMDGKRPAAEAAEKAAASQAAAASKSSGWTGWFSDMLHIVIAAATVVIEICMAIITAFTAICTAIANFFTAMDVEGNEEVMNVEGNEEVGAMDVEGNEQQTRKAEAEKFTTRKEMYRTTTCVIQELQVMNGFANDLTKEIESLGKYAAEGVKNEDMIDEVIEDVKSQAETFRVDINHLTTHTRGCKEDIMTGRDKVVALIRRT